MCPLNFALITEVCSTLNTISSVGIHLTKCLPHSSLHLNRCNQGDVEAFVTLPKILLFFNFSNNTEVFTRLHINQQMPKLAVDSRTLSAEKNHGHSPSCNGRNAKFKSLELYFFRQCETSCFDPGAYIHTLFAVVVDRPV